VTTSGIVSAQYGEIPAFVFNIVSFHLFNFVSLLTDITILNAWALDMKRPILVGAGKCLSDVSITNTFLHRVIFSKKFFQGTQRKTTFAVTH
jgi:hypothetical protein